MAISQKTADPIATKLGRDVQGMVKTYPKIFGAVPASASGPKWAPKWFSSRFTDFGLWKPLNKVSGVGKRESVNWESKQIFWGWGALPPAPSFCAMALSICTV